MKRAVSTTSLPSSSHTSDYDPVGFQVTRIREYEVHRVRAEEQAAFRQQLATARARADAEYQETLRGLKEREAAMTAAMQRRERVNAFVLHSFHLCAPPSRRHSCAGAGTRAV